MKPIPYIREVADYYPDEESIRMILGFASIDCVNLDLSGKPIVVWYSAMKEAIRQNKLPKLINTLGDQYLSLKLDETSLYDLRIELSGSPFNPPKKYNKIYLVVFVGFLLIGAWLIYKPSMNSERTLQFVLHQSGQKLIHPLSDRGQVKLIDTISGNALVVKIGNGGYFSVEDAPIWLLKNPINVILEAPPLIDSNITVSQSIHTFNLKDTNFIALNIIASSNSSTAGKKNNADIDLPNQEPKKPARFDWIKSNMVNIKGKGQIKSYSINKFEVTYEDWRKVMGKNARGYIEFDSCPVANVTIDEINGFINKLKQFFPKMDYRLPTEEEWKYAAKGGDTPENYNYAGSDNLKDVGHYNIDQENRTHNVGKLLPNIKGLRDMSGNVWELCEDYYKDSKGRIIKGGSYQDPEEKCTIEFQGIWGEKTDFDHNPHVGFRLVGIYK